MYTLLNRCSHLKFSLPITQRRKADAKMHHKLEMSHRTVILQTPHYLEETKYASLFFSLIARGRLCHVKVVNTSLTLSEQRKDATAPPCILHSQTDCSNAKKEACFDKT